MKEKSLRENLLEFLQKGPAHLSLKDALTGIKVNNRFKQVPNSPTTIWEELEHIRLAQEDILRYTLDPSWQSPEWPAGYWPEKSGELTDDQWDKTVTLSFADIALASSNVITFPANKQKPDRASQSGNRFDFKIRLFKFKKMSKFG